MFFHFTEQDLENLKDNKYSCNDLSIAGRYVMQRYWNFLLRFVPRWAHPNVISFSGLAVISIACLFVTYYVDNGFMVGSVDEAAAKEVPSWVWYCCCFALFAYQTLDALDGKQARRLGTGSPLGEIVDHGCDALTTIIFEFLCAAAVAPGFATSLIATVFSIGFFTSLWEHYCTGTFFLGYMNGPTEGLLLGCTIFFSTGYYGRSLWTSPAYLPDALKQSIPLPFGYPSLRITNLGEMLIYSTIASFVVTIGTTFVHVGRASKLGLLKPVKLLAPLLVLSVATWHVVIVNKQTLYQPNFFLFDAFFGLICATASTRITISRLLHIEYNSIFPTFFLGYLFIVPLASYCFVAGPLPATWIPYVAVTTKALTAASVIDYLGTCYELFTGFARFLHIRVMKFTPEQCRKIRTITF